MKHPKFEVRVEGRVEMHLPGGYTKLAVFSGGTSSIEVPTESIPEHLRSLGTRVLVISTQSDDTVRVGEDEFHKWDKKVITDLPENPILGRVDV